MTTQTTSRASITIVRRATGTYTLLRRRDGIETVWRSGIGTHDEALRRARVLCDWLGDQLIDKAAGR